MLAFSVPARNVSLHPDAERDIEDGLAFYSSRSVLAAERFLSDVDAALDLIAEAVAHAKRRPLYWTKRRF